MKHKKERPLKGGSRGKYERGRRVGGTRKWDTRRNELRGQGTKSENENGIQQVPAAAGARALCAVFVIVESASALPRGSRLMPSAR
eukprot:6213430-Pleurochrysis_carterae.AAC.2